MLIHNLFVWAAALKPAYKIRVSGIKRKRETTMMDEYRDKLLLAVDRWFTDAFENLKEIELEPDQECFGQLAESLRHGWLKL